jgi:hypothetical protein
MRELFADGEFALHLLDESDVFWVRADDVLKRKGLARQGIHDCVDGTTRTFSQALQNFKVEEFLRHLLTATFE